MVLFGLLVVLATAVSAADDTPPTVVGPTDRPGADVVWYKDQEYTLNATGSRDDKGIVSYKWEVFDPADAITEFTSTTPTARWTPTSFGIYKVISWAYDAAGNKGAYVYAIDVVEVIPAQLIKDTSVNYDHSVAVTSGELNYTNTDITVTGGRKGEGTSVSRGEMFSEDVNQKSGKYPGVWQTPYGGDPYYGTITRDTSVKLVGAASIKCEPTSYYTYGFEYVFDNPADLTAVNMLTFWMRCDSSSYPYVYEIYFFGPGGMSSWNSYYYSYCYYYGNYQTSGTWQGISISTDMNRVNYGYSYNYDPAQCYSIWFYAYTYYTPVWIDCVYLSKDNYIDNITESASPTGPWAGYWSGGTTSTNAYVGSKSVSMYVSGTSYINYYWNTPVDLSSYNALRLFNWYPNYYYIQFYGMYFYSSSGYAYMSMSHYFHFYATYMNSRWFLANVPFDRTGYYNYGVDWTKITNMQFYTYAYYSGYCDIDGLEFYAATGAAGGAPTLQETIPHGIYAMQTGKLTMQDVRFSSPAAWGAFVRCDNDLTIRSSTFDGLWGTMHPSILTEAQTYGGILAFNANNVLLDGITITKASSSGIYVQNSNIMARNLDFSGYGAGFPGAAGLIIAESNTRVNEVDTVTVEKSRFHDAPGGSGIMVLSQNALGDATVMIDRVVASSNGVYGVSIEVVGMTGNLTVNIEDSEFQLNTDSGFAFVAHDCKANVRSKVKFTITSSEAIENGGYGFLFSVKKGVMSATGTVTDVSSYDNEANGLGFDIASMGGEFKMLFVGIDSYDNIANGMFSKVTQAKFKDPQGNEVVGNGKLIVDIRDSAFRSNDNDGVHDEYSASSSYNDANRPVVRYELKATRVAFERNGRHGYSVQPNGNPSYSPREVYYEFQGCTFSDNTRDGFYNLHQSQNYYYYDGLYNREHYMFYDCNFTYNMRGIENQLGSMSYAYNHNGESTIHAFRCRFQDNDYETIRCTGYDYIYGGAMITGVEFRVEDSLLDGYVHLDISGVHDGYGYLSITPYIRVYLINDTYTSDVPMLLRFTGEMYSYYAPIETTLVYKNVKHTSPSTGDGLRVDMSSGCYLKAIVDVEDMVFENPLGDGIHATFGTTYQWQQGKAVTVRLIVRNVEINYPMEKGIYTEIVHVSAAGASQKGSYTLENVTIRSPEVAIKTQNLDGEIRNCHFFNPKQENIYTYYGVIDVYESEVGAIAESNLRVDEKGAIRLWFQMGVRVIWKGTSDPVIGASVEIKDNSWNILGINAINSPDPVVFTNLNAYTVLPEGIFTKNPYIITVDFLGIVKEVRTQVDKNTEVTIELVDDIAPRLTIESPKDGQEQREQSVLVKGTAYDKHTGLDRVMVSTDGKIWRRATIDPNNGFTYTYNLEGLAEGLTIIRVRSYDLAGNFKEGSATILVDSTPPQLNVITPTDGMRTSKRSLEIVGTTDVGAKVYINDRPIDIQYTLISHQLVLAEGPNAIKVAAVDYLGNVNEVVRYVTLDTQAPYIAMVTEDQVVSTPEVTVIGLTEVTDVTIKVAGSPVAVDAEGRFTARVMLKEGLNKVEVYGVDGVGNDRIVLLSLTLDRTAPWVRLIEPSGTMVVEKDILVSGFVEIGSSVFINDREVDVTFGHFETTVSALEGDFKLHIVAMDEAGNEAVLDRVLRVDTVPPALEVRQPADNFVTNEPTVAVVGAIALDDEREGDIRFLELYINDVPRLFNFQSGEFSQDLMLEEGVNRIVVRAVDLAGNQASVTRTVMLDSQAPYLSAQVGNVRMDSNWNEPVSLSDFVYVAGFTEIGAALTIDGVSVEVDAETGSFNYSMTLPEPTGDLRIATKTIRVVSTDPAGNVATHEQAVNRITTVEKTEEGAGTAQWLVLVLALVIFGLSFAGAMGYQRMQAQEELIEELGSKPTPVVTPEGKVVSSPPARPVRGGRARAKPPAEKGDEVVVDLDKEEVK